MTGGPACRLALVAAALLAGGACHHAHRPTARVIVLGIDGMDYRVMRELMAQGRLPNFSRMAASGTFSALATSTPPQSPVAWSSVITGLDPGGHGIFDFLHRDPRTMIPYLSTTRADSPRALAIGSWRIPLWGGGMTLLRDGRPFWEVLGQQDVDTTIVRMPANFPPSGTAARELSGMGTPDLLGTYGTFSFYTSAASEPAERPVAGGVVYHVAVDHDIVKAELVGPDNPFRTPARRTTVPFALQVDAGGGAARLEVGDQTLTLRVGAWSNWVPIDFRLMPLQSVRGMCRFYLKRVRPTFELYVSPINLDPEAPAMSISRPSSYAGDLARQTGRYYTQGMAADTKALSDGILSRDEFLEQASSVRQESLRQYWHVLNDFKDGVLFYYFGDLDQISHMLWRARDPGHPAYDPDRDAPYAGVIDDLYVAYDDLLGETLRRAGPDTSVLVLSDHGFTSWRRTFNLNTWLYQQGYLALRNPAIGHDPGLLQNIDWSRTRAYGLGLNGLYLNRRGRERWGIVPDEDAASLADEIRQKLVAMIDPRTGRPSVARVYPRERIYPDPRHFDVAPDLIVGYAEGTRVSNESALGGVSDGVLADNTGEWSGDHCMDPDAVPGIFLTNRPLRRNVRSVQDVAGAILAEFGLEFAARSRER